MAHLPFLPVGVAGICVMQFRVFCLENAYLELLLVDRVLHQGAPRSSLPCEV